MESDFDRWLKYHGKAYSGFAKWIKENSDQVRFMRRLLEQFSIEQLSSATDRLYALDEQPRGYGEHARKIRGLIQDGSSQCNSEMRWGPECKHDRLIADCPKCMDYGFIAILSPQTLKHFCSNYDTEAREVTDRGYGVRTCEVACTCRRGQILSRKCVQWQPGHLLIPLDDVWDRVHNKHMDLFDAAVEEWQVRSQEWLASNKGAEQMENYDPALEGGPDF